MPQNQLFPLLAVGFILLVAGIGVYVRMLLRVNDTGSRIRSDLFGLPDTLVAMAVTLLFIFLLAMQWISPESGPPTGAGKSSPHEIKGFEIILSALFYALPAAGVVGLLIRRNVNLTDLFGLRRVGFFEAVLLAGGLLVMMLPIFFLVTVFAYELLGKNAEPQELVKIYQDAAKTGKSNVVWQIVVAAVCIAPVTEEILFRGYCYPVFKRVIGPLPAALGTSFLFAAVHNNALGFPGLALLALALTLVYERTGSLLVAILMHSWFNGTSLFIMWWAVTHQLVK